VISEGLAKEAEQALGECEPSARIGGGGARRRANLRPDLARQRRAPSTENVKTAQRAYVCIWQRAYSRQASAEHFQQRAEFLPLRNRSLGSLAVTPNQSPKLALGCSRATATVFMRSSSYADQRAVQVSGIRFPNVTFYEIVGQGPRGSAARPGPPARRARA
jgi:hypothetical protein